MRNYKKVGVAAFVLLTLFVLSGIIGIFAAGHIFDEKFDNVIKRINQKVPNLSLSYEIQDKSFTKRQGKIYFSYKLPQNNLLNEKVIKGESYFVLNLGLFQAQLNIEKTPNAGNFDKIFTDLGLETINYRGLFEASLFSLNAQGAFKIDRFNIPFEDGPCVVGESSVYLKLLSLSKARSEFSLGGISCKSPLMYQGKSAYDLLVKGLSIKAFPQKEGDSFTISKIDLGLKELKAQASTLYLIGFSPKEKVSDPSIREGFSLKDIAVNLKLDDKDEHKRQTLSFASHGNIAFAFPLIKDNQEQEIYKIDDYDVEASLGKIDSVGLFKYLAKGNFSFEKFTSYLDPKVQMNLNNFKFMYEGEIFNMQGMADISIKNGRFASDSFNARFEGKAGKNMVNKFVSDGYEQSLYNLKKDGSIDFDGENYYTVMEIKDGRFTLNGVALSN